MLKKIIIVIATLGAFVIGFLVASILHSGSPLIDIEITNNSGEDIQSIKIDHEIGRDNKIQYQFGGLKTGSKKLVHLYAPAESSYEVTVAFTDGKKITGGEGYVEAGYHVTEIIEKDKIESKVDIFRSYKH
jgi:hypothetical protein